MGGRSASLPTTHWLNETRCSQASTLSLACSDRDVRDEEPAAVAVIGEGVRGGLSVLGHLGQCVGDDCLQCGDGLVGRERFGVAAGEFQTSREILELLGIPFGPIRVIQRHGDHHAGNAGAGLSRGGDPVQNLISPAISSFGKTQWSREACPGGDGIGHRDTVTNPHPV